MSYASDLRAERAVLLADDDGPFADVIAYRLEREGHEVVRAVDGDEALGWIRRGGIAAVIASESLPGAGALELRERARENSGSSPPFLALVAHGRREELLRCLSEGVDDCVEKPVSPGEIVARLRRITE